MTKTKKTCFKCHRTLLLKEFYDHPMMRDGKLGKCKDCTKKDTMKNREEKIDYYLEYDRKRASLPKRVMARKLYARTERGMAAQRRGGKRWSKDNKHKKNASLKVRRAIKKGILHRMPCEVCAVTKTHAHHDDYSKPLEVRWLCCVHHFEWHKKQREAQRSSKTLTFPS